MPSPTPTLPPASELVVDDFEGYSDDDALRAVYSVNDVGGANVGQVSLAYPPDVGGGDQGAAFYYEIRISSARYAGFERRMPAQNWGGNDTLNVWVKSDGSDRKLAIQFGETSGEVWRCQIQLSTFDSQHLALALDKGTFQWADWSSWDNGQIDLEAIDYYGFFVGGGLGAGTIYVDEMALSR